jgi:kynurenine formamidase
MIAPLVVLDILDIAQRAASDLDTVATLADVDAWEHRFGVIPGKAFVALRTGWDLRWPDAVQMANRSADGVAHFPGWAPMF